MKKKLKVVIKYDDRGFSKKKWFRVNAESVKYCLDTFYAGIVQFSVEELEEQKEMRHPNLSDEINDNIEKSEKLGGEFIEKLKVGNILEVQTKNTLYKIEKREDGLYISGHQKFCPNPVQCNIHGSTWGGSMLKMGFVGIDMHLEFSLVNDHGVITTSPIQKITKILKE